MNLIDSQDKSLEVLKSFNSAIVACRIYPPDAPQVTTAVDRGYKSLKQILRQKGAISFVFKNDIPLIAGKVISQDTLDSFPNLVVFRQLRLLGLSQLVMAPEMDRFAFGQLLAVFNATIPQIKAHGGGMEYTTSLGLTEYFPEQLVQQETAEQNLKPKADGQKVVKVRPALVACLLGRDKRPAVLAELKKKMLDPDSAVTILTSGIALILHDIKQTKSITISPLFPMMLHKADKMIEAKQKGKISRGLARMVVNNLKDTTFCVLLCQEYPNGLGSRFYDEQLNLVSQDRLGNLFTVMREQLRKAVVKSGVGSAQEEILGKSLQKLKDTRKGTAFLNAEKAKKIINEGEKTRKKNRLEVGVKELIQGSTIPLKSSELVVHLPRVIMQMLRNKEEDSITILLLNFINYCVEDEKIPGDALLHNCFVTISEILVGQKQWKYVELVYGSLLDLGGRLEVPDELSERTIALLLQLMQASWQREDNEKGDTILYLIQQIRSGQKKDSLALKGVVGKIQDKSIVRANLPVLLKQCLGSPRDEILGYRLIYQGPVVIRFLVDSLIKSEKSADRIKLLDLLTYSPHFLVTAVLERLPGHMPWYGKRNLIKLLGETGSENNVAAVISYLTHEDFRVQREAFLCLYKIGGNSRKKFLLQALDNSSEMIKIDIITALRKYSDEDVAEKLNELINERESFSEPLRNKILLETIETLGRCSCAPALKYMQNFLQLRKQRAGRKITQDVWNTAEKAVRFLENDLKEVRKKHIHASQLRKQALKQVSRINRPMKASRFITGSLEEKSVRALLSNGQTKDAQTKLILLIERVARSGNFSQAEKLREWLVEIDSAGLQYIVEAAEIIDREKVQQLDTTHLEIWNELYELLSTEEFLNLFGSLQHRSFTNEEIVVHQGTLQPSLFFINSGKVKLFFQEKGDEVLVKTLSTGEILGAGAFFDASVWTISAASIGSSDISILRLEELQKWSEEYPGIEAKLANFCRQFERIQEFINKSSKERRVHKRVRLEGRISTMLLDNQGRSTGVNPKGVLYDISLGGIAYVLRISVAENVRQALGRQVVLELPYGTSPGEVISVEGDILALKKTHTVDNDYSVHVQFKELLTNEQLEIIVAAARRESQI